MNTFWVFTLIGTVSFSIQGAIIAMEEDYDLFGVYLFGILTAFGGGAVRSMLMRASDFELWDQGPAFYAALIAITSIIVFPIPFQRSRVFWENILDAIGLISFAIQGSMVAIGLNLPASAAVTAALLTAVGGGMIRDVLSNRQPIVLGEVVYGFWALCVGLIMGYRLVTSTVGIYILFFIFTGLRILSFRRKWKIPVALISNDPEDA